MNTVKCNIGAHAECDGFHPWAGGCELGACTCQCHKPAKEGEDIHA